MSDALPQERLIKSVPANETQRLSALHRYRVLDTPPEVAFDRITRLAARLFDMPTVLISLVDESRAWFKSCVGFDAGEVPRDATLCSFAVLADEPLIIPDARLDDRFACNPFVQSEPGVRFYAGAPLLSQDGFNLGTLCLLDSQPRDFLSVEQQATLVDLAAMVVDELELRLASHKIAQVDAALLEITQGVATVTGGDFFDALVQHFANVLDTDYVYIGLVGGDDPKRMRTIATCAHGRIVENFEYLLQDTPCWEVIEQRKICCYPHNVQAEFPNAPLLKPLSIESYIATPFFGSNGTVLGLLGVMDGKPLENVHLAESLVSIFADRIATELERQQTEVALRESEEKYRMLFESIDEGFCICEMLFDENGEPQDYRFVEVNSVFEKLTGLEQATGKTARELVPALEAFWVEIYSKVVQTGEPVRFEQQSGAMNRWFNVNAFCIGAAQSHQFGILFTNISDRKQAEQERERFLALGSDLQVITGSNGYFQWVSPTFEQTLGWTLAEMTAHTWTEFVHPDDVNASVSETVNLFAGNETLSFENRYRHKDGSYRWFLWKAQPYLEEQVIYGAAVDITDRKRVEDERKQAQTALEQSEEQSRQILESISDAFFALDENWLFTYVNRAAETLLDRAPGDLIGKSIWEEYPGLNGSEFEQLYRRVANQRVAESLTAFYPDHDRWYEVRTYPATNGVTIYFRNVTDRKQAEATIQASNERLKLLSTIANDLLLNEDPKAFLASLFAQFSTNLGLEVYFNYLFESDQQRLQLHAYGGIADEIAESAKVLQLGQGVCGYAVQQRQPAVVEDALKSDSALALPLQSIGLRAYASHPLIVGDRILGTLGLGTRQRDRFTHDELALMQAVANQVAAALERSRLVSELEARAEALAQTNRIKDEFLAVLSHELRSPLNPILGWTRLLQSGKLDSVRQTEALKTIERNAKLQTQLIEDLLDIARIMQGKLTLTADPVSLTFVISAAIETVRLAAEAKNIQILLDLSTTVSHVFGDATRLQQVLWNLLTNAVKFTPQGGQIAVELRQLDQLAQIRVSDTGKGIDPQFLPYVFEYFRQADSTTTRKFGGLGLGLAIVQQIVEMHGGTVKVASSGEDQGATFTVQLPVIQQKVPTIALPVQAKAEKAENPLSNLQILVVDDDADTREFQAFLLQQSGARVIAVASGLEALQALDLSIPDVLVSDVGMPEMDGYMLIRQIRSRPPHQGGTIRAIAVTAYARDFDQQKALQSGFQGHITKPVEPEILVKAIVDLLDHLR